jgi:glycerol-3-phosphate acyltransferase PlsX
MMKIGRIAGIERPAIATLIPSQHGKTVLLDAGANVDCNPENLVDFATMGSIYAEQVLGIEKPRIGLLSIGEEATKGNELTKNTYTLLQETPINFVGNVEGRHLFADEADVIVCDGFIGNVALKVSEGIGEFLLDSIKREVMRSPLYQFAALLLSPALKRLKRKVDYAEYGGAPLLGVNGICIISHGRSDARAIFNAVRAATVAVDSDVVGRIKNALLVDSKSPTTNAVP